MDQDDVIHRQLADLIANLEARVLDLELADPPDSWARSTAWLVDKYVTTPNVLKVAATLASAWLAIHSAVNGVPAVPGV